LGFLPAWIRHFRFWNPRSPSFEWFVSLFTKDDSADASGLIPQAPLHTSSLTVMGWEDAHSEKPTPGEAPTRTESGRLERDLPRSYPRGEGQHDLEMRNLGVSDPDNGGEGMAIQRSRSPVETLRRRLSRDPQVQREREREEEAMRNRREVPIAVVEQRLSNLAQGCLCESIIRYIKDEANNIKV
jgi:hypothetical protein